MTTTAPAPRLIGVAGNEPRRLENFVVVGGYPGAVMPPISFTPSRARRSPRRRRAASTSADGRVRTRVGGPALRKMTFHERALMLKAMAQYLMARKDEFYLVSAATGATKQDSWVDIEGGIGTFFAYASRGRREFPNETLLYRWADRSPCRRAGRSSGATSACRSRASPSTSTRSTSPSGECWRSSRRRCSPACRRSSSRRRSRRTSPKRCSAR